MKQAGWHYLAGTALDLISSQWGKDYNWGEIFHDTHIIR